MACLSLVRPAVAFTAGLVMVASLYAADGQQEINQACAVNTGCFEGDGPGFPVTISQPGSYRLTGNLDLTAENPATNGIDISAPATTVDLGGFQIIGPARCSGACGAVSCGSSSGSSGWAVVFQAGAFAGTVRNGTVRNMGNTGIGSAAQGLRVVGITAFHNAYDGIGTYQNTIVLDSIVFENGQDGIDVDAGSLIENSSAACNRNHGIEIDGVNGVIVSTTVQGNGVDGIHITSGGTVIENVTASGNVDDGIESTGFGSVIRSTAARGNGGNGVSVSADGSVIEDVVTSTNGVDGIVSTSGTVIKRVTAANNGGNGISATGFGSLVSDSNARGNNGYGIFLGSASSRYRGNVSTANGQVDSCGGGVCTGGRRFYLTKTTHDGAGTLQACRTGFHMAALFEIFDTTTLRYDHIYGATTLDSGLGPPVDKEGRIRNGSDSGGSSCYSWTTNESGPRGTTAEITRTWESPADEVSPWNVNNQPCRFFFPVWCVEDD